MEDFLIIRRATLKDKKIIFDFIKKVYHNWESIIPDRWNWLYVINPYIVEGKLPIWIALDDTENVIGQICSMLEPLKIGDQEYICSLGVDYYVFQSYRGQGIGKNLLIIKDYIMFMAISMSQTTRYIHKSLGFYTVTDIYYYYLNLNEHSLYNIVRRNNIGRFFINCTLFKNFCKFLARLTNKWLGYKRKRNKIDLEGLCFVPISHIGKQFDTLWEQISVEFDCAVIRNCTYLNWKYAQQPNVKYNIFLAKVKGKVVGYMILRKRQQLDMTRGIIVDFLFSTKKEKMILAGINFAIDYFLDQGITDIRVATSVNDYAKCLKKMGFPWPISKAKPLFQSNIPIDNKKIVNAKWLLSYGDHDQQQ